MCLDRWNSEAIISESGDPAYEGLNTKTHEKPQELRGKDVSRVLLIHPLTPSFLWATNCG